MQKPLFSLRSVRVRGSLFYSTVSFYPNSLTLIGGKSGCGKSTLLQLLNGTTEYEAGEILYKGQDIKTVAPLALRKEVLLVPQKIYLYPESIKENFAKFCNLLEKPCPSDSEIQTHLNELGLNKDLDVSCQELSGGERHRVYLALCLSLRPQVLLLDEPTSALDGENAKKLINLLRRLKNTCTIIMVCHDQSLFEYADTCIYLGQ